MQILYNALKVCNGRSNDSPLEVTLYEGIRPNMQASSLPIAYAEDKKSDNPGRIIVGFVHYKNDNYIEMTPDKIDDISKQTILGGWRIYRDSIHTISILDRDN